MSQQFCLRWNNHQPNFISVFTNLLNTESLVDVTLAAEGKHLQAHKVVLSACSVYFQTLFTANPSRHPIVILKDVKYSDLRIMVDFMYCGEVNVSQEQLPQILETAKMLKIKGLTEMPDSASLTKAQNTSSDRQEMATPGDSSWESQQRHSMSPSNSSPTTKKRSRIRKSSTGSGSASNERPSEERMYDQSNTSLNLVKTMPENNNPGMVMCNPNQQIRPRQQFEHYTQETNTIETMQQPSDDSTNCLLRPVGVNSVDEGQSSSSVQQTGAQWTLLEHGPYSRYATQSNLEGSSPLMHPNIDQFTTFPYNIQNQTFNEEVTDYQQQMMRAVSPNSMIMQNNQAMQQDEPPPKRRRTSNPQAHENFQRALDAVRFGGIGFCKAAKMFGVNNRTLWLEYKKKGFPNLRPSIKNRIKREQNSPPPERKEEIIENNENLVTTAAAALYSPATTVLGFMDARYLHEHNLHPINFNAVQ